MRFYNSSQISAYQDCPSLWGREWVTGTQVPLAPDVPWESIVALGDRWQRKFSWKQRALALGTATHWVLERWYLTRAETVDAGVPKIDWASYPAQVALAGLHLLPHPGECEEILPEAEFTLPCSDVPELGDWPGLGLRGTIDLQVRTTPKELARLGVASPSGWLLIDFKTTASLRYAKTPTQWHADAQGTIYPLKAMHRVKIEAMPSRWAYFESKKVRRAAAVDFLPTFESVTANARNKLLPVVRTLDDHVQAKTPISALAQNPEACERYAGCPYHIARGGNCPGGRASTGRARWKLVRASGPAKEKEIDTMATFAERQAAMRREKEAKAAAAKQPEPEPAEADEAEEETAQAEPEPTPEPAKAAPKERNTPSPAKRNTPPPKLAEADEAIHVELTITKGGILIRMPVPPDLRERAEAIVAAVESASA